MIPNTFPPAGPTTLTKTINAYLYQQYNDDDDLAAFVDAYNEFSQQYVDWFVNIGLPVYTGAQITGPLLDWIAAGLYGMTRPVLPSGVGRLRGPYNTFDYNDDVYNGLRSEQPSNVFVTTDDVFKRILTWHLWKGDGKIFNIRWLKRRVMRFLTGDNGTAGQTDETYPVSVTFGVGNQVNINLLSVRRIATGGAIYGAGRYNTFFYNELDTRTVITPVSPLVPIFKAAMDAGALEVPFQFVFVVNI